MTRSFAAILVTAFTLAACGGGGGGSSTPPINTPTQTPTQSPTSTPTSPNAATAFTCPPNDSSEDSVARAARVSGDAMGRSYGLRVGRNTTATTSQLAVTYSTSMASSNAATIQSRERAAGGAILQQYAFSHLGKTIHVLTVPAQQTAAIAANLRTQSGVLSVAATGQRRFQTTVTHPYWTNDPYFNGFTAAESVLAGNSGQPNTYQQLPYAEAAMVPGQWDMHAIDLGQAFEYSQSANGSNVGPVAGALGSNNVKIAIIDTGEDPNHPELSGKIAYQKCYITNAAGTAQSTSNFETDPDGHGTDVSGIAAAATNNSFGFTGTGGNVELYAYRVFPTPDDNCLDETSNDPQCGASTADIASAIDDAVSQHVNVISMSLGGGSGTGANAGCPTAGVDSDPVEGAAVAEAIAANVIVVAAAGNSGGLGLSAPGCDSGVIAVGASSLDDGMPNGTGSFGGTTATPVEYVASYSQYGTTNAKRSSSSWGLIAPGGDPNTNNDTDDLHWIENIWTTAPYMSSASDTGFAGSCTSDYGTTSAADCRTLIAGTSMATPHVAGAAALILSVNSMYQSPSTMFQLLCSTADNLPASASTQGCGRLNVYNAMALAVGDSSPPTPVP